MRQLRPSALPRLPSQLLLHIRTAKSTMLVASSRFVFSLSSRAGWVQHVERREGGCQTTSNVVVWYIYRHDTLWWKKFAQHLPAEGRFNPSLSGREWLEETHSRVSQGNQPSWYTGLTDARLIFHMVDGLSQQVGPATSKCSIQSYYSKYHNPFFRPLNAGKLDYSRRRTTAPQGEN